MAEVLTDAELDALPDHIRRSCGHDTRLLRLVHEVRRLRARAPENQPDLTGGARERTDRLRALCQQVVACPPDQWLSEAACAAIQKLQARVAELEALVASLSERCQRQSECLSRAAEKPPTWTSQLPTELGHYWHRGGSEYSEPRVYKVCGDMFGLSIWMDGYRFRLADLGGEWAGPLEPPA